MNVLTYLTCGQQRFQQNGRFAVIPLLKQSYDQHDKGGTGSTKVRFRIPLFFQDGKIQVGEIRKIQNDQFASSIPHDQFDVSIYQPRETPVFTLSPLLVSQKQFETRENFRSEDSEKDNLFYNHSRYKNSEVGFPDHNQSIGKSSFYKVRGNNQPPTTHRRGNYRLDFSTEKNNKQKYSPLTPNDNYQSRTDQHEHFDSSVEGNTNEPVINEDQTYSTVSGYSKYPKFASDLSSRLADIKQLIYNSQRDPERGHLAVSTNNANNKGHSVFFSQHVPVEESIMHPVKDLPACTNSILGYCPFQTEYPSDLSNVVRNRYSYKLKTMLEELHTVSDDTGSYGYSKSSGGLYICPSELRELQPGWARNISGNWIAIFNSEHIPQKVKVEVCKREGANCPYIRRGIYSECKQRFSLHRLVAFDPFHPHTGPFVGVFRLPSCCSCWIGYGHG